MDASALLDLTDHSRRSGHLRTWLQIIGATVAVAVDQLEHGKTQAAKDTLDPVVQDIKDLLARLDDADAQMLARVARPLRRIVIGGRTHA